MQISLNLAITGTITISDDPPEPTNLWPDPECSDETGYFAQGDCVKDPGVLNWPGIDNNGFARFLTQGGLQTAAIAAIANNTEFMVSVNVANFVNNPGFEVTLRGGTPVSLGIVGNGWSTPVSVTSGADGGETAVMVIGSLDFVPQLEVTDILITAA